MATSNKTTGQKPWEVLDENMTDDNVSCVSQEEEKAIDEALGLQMISIRLERSLIANLKEVAEHHKIGYQPLIRDLLNRFAKSEMRNILQARLASIQRDIGSQAPLEAVDVFLEREHKRA